MNTAEQIDALIASLEDWRGEKLLHLRKLIHDADPDIVEEWKWGTAIFTHKKMVCAISSFKEHVKINFFKGAFLKDTNKLINVGFDSKQHRAIDFHKDDTINESALIELIREAVAINKQ